MDIREYPLETMELVRGLGLTTLAALHDLNIAADYCDLIHVIDSGRIVASGRPSDVLQPDIIAEVFGVGALVGKDTLTGRPRISFYLKDHSPKEAVVARSSSNGPAPSRQ